MTISYLILKRIYRHIIGVLLFIFCEAGLILIISPESSYILILPFYIPAIILFYANACLTLKFWLNKKTKWIVFILYFFEIFIYALIAYGMFAFIRGIALNDKEIWDIKFIAKESWRALNILFFSTAYWIAIQNIKNAKRANLLELQRAEDEKNKALLENALLRSQINFHFVFNTINFVYGIVEELSETAAKALLNLSNFVKYAFSEVDARGLIDLSKEIEQIEKLVETIQFRFNNQLQISIIKEVETGIGFQIPPLLLLSFVENMFSYGIMTPGSVPARIELELKPDYFHFRTTNQIRPDAEHRGRGIGISNSLLRLMAFFPDNHIINMATEENCFILDLKINL